MSGLKDASASLCWQKYNTYRTHSESLTIAKELEIEISRAIDSLSPQCRNVFRLSRIKEMKNKEVAQFLGITEKAVEKQISKALKQIRGILNKKFRV